MEPRLEDVVREAANQAAAGAESQWLGDWLGAFVDSAFEPRDKYYSPS